MGFANHPAASDAHAQNMTAPALVQPAAAIADTAGHAAIAPGNPAPTSNAFPQALPVINTARLIQSMGQSEMRVGMRSSEFGNISINTSATRDLISAQISLDHGELARTLAAHLPEMQARLGSNQAVDLRIDTNGATSGQGAGTSGDTSNGSAGQSRNGGQQAGYATSDSSHKGVAEWQQSPVAGAIATGESGLDTRLDIRV
jgi:hypothetical protein